MAEDIDAMKELAETVGLKPGHAIRFQTNLVKEAAKVAKERPQTQETKKRTVEI
jgi:pyrroline-5-carboxylate reductase